MKRILLSLILISSAFACNAMSDKEKFDSLKEACKCPNVSVKKVNTLLTNNTYVSNNPKKLLRLALKIYKVMEFSREFTEDELNRYSPKELLNTLAYIRIVEIAHEHTSLSDQINIENMRQSQQRIKTYLEKSGRTVDDSDGSSIISLLFSKKTALAATGLIAAYLGYSYLTKSEKSNNPTLRPQ